MTPTKPPYVFDIQGLGITAQTVTTPTSTSSQNVTVNLGFSGSASAADYTANAQIVITAGNRSGFIQLTAVNDTLVEGGQDIVIDVTSVSNSTESGTQQQTITITDNDTATLSFASGSSPETIQFLSGSASSTHNASLGIVDDPNSEGNETIRLALNTLSDGTGGQVGLVVSRAQGLLANDTDPDGNPLQVRLVRGPAMGRLVLRSDGSFTYTPKFGYLGTVTFSYRVFDGIALSNTVTVTLSVSVFGRRLVVNG